MASFVPWYGKKRSRLAELERHFVELLNAEASVDELTNAAEAIRAAHVRALKEKSARFAPSEKNARIFSRIDDDVRYWMDLSTDAIIAGYRDPELRRRMSSEVRRR